MKNNNTILCAIQYSLLYQYIIKASFLKNSTWLNFTYIVCSINILFLTRFKYCLHMLILDLRTTVSNTSLAVGRYPVFCLANRTLTPIINSLEEKSFMFTILILGQVRLITGQFALHGQDSAMLELEIVIKTPLP